MNEHNTPGGIPHCGAGPAQVSDLTARQLRTAQQLADLLLEEPGLLDELTGLPKIGDSKPCE